MGDPLYELQILREATRLLMKTEQLSNEDEKLIATQVRAVLTTGQRHPLSDADVPPLQLDLEDELLQLHNAEAPPFMGFTVEERTCQLGYRLLPKQYISLIPRLELRVRMEWASRFHGTPAQHQDQDWYSVEDAQWVDPMIQAYLNQFPNITRVQAVEE